MSAAASAASAATTEDWPLHRLAYARQSQETVDIDEVMETMFEAAKENQGRLFPSMMVVLERLLDGSIGNDNHDDSFSPAAHVSSTIDDAELQHRLSTDRDAERAARGNTVAGVTLELRMVVLMYDMLKEHVSRGCSAKFLKRYAQGIASYTHVAKLLADTLPVVNERAAMQAKVEAFRWYVRDFTYNTMRTMDAHEADRYRTWTRFYDDMPLSPEVNALVAANPFRRGIEELLAEMNEDEERDALGAVEVANHPTLMPRDGELGFPPDPDMLRDWICMPNTNVTRARRVLHIINTFRESYGEIEADDEEDEDRLLALHHESLNAIRQAVLKLIITHGHFTRHQLVDLTERLDIDDDNSERPLTVPEFNRLAGILHMAPYDVDGEVSNYPKPTEEYTSVFPLVATGWDRQRGAAVVEMGRESAVLASFMRHIGAVSSVLQQKRLPSSAMGVIPLDVEKLILQFAYAHFDPAELSSRAVYVESLMPKADTEEGRVAQEARRQRMLLQRIANVERARWSNASATRALRNDENEALEALYDAGRNEPGNAQKLQELTHRVREVNANLTAAEEAAVNPHEATWVGKVALLAIAQANARRASARAAASPASASAAAASSTPARPRSPDTSNAQHPSTQKPRLEGRKPKW